MLRSDLTVAVRHLRKRWGPTLLTVLGLAVALTGSLLLGLYVRHELSYDAFHEHADRIVRVTSTDSTGGGTRRAKVSALLAPRLAARRPEVAVTVRLDRADPVTVRAGQEPIREDRLFYADTTFFDVFSFSLRRGDPETVLEAPDAAVLSATAATRYFGTDNPVGRRLAVPGVDTFTVTGVMADPPTTSHVRPRVVASFRAKEPIERYYDTFAWTYVLLEPGVSVAAFDEVLAGFVDDKGWTQPGLQRFGAQRLTDIHLHSFLVQEIRPGGDPQTVWILGGAAVLLLLVAGSNFVTMTLSRTLDRAAEIGMRRAVGAGRGALLRLFAVEAGLIVGAAAAGAVAGSAALLGPFGDLLGTPLSVAGLLRPGLIGGAVLVLAGLVGAAAAVPVYALATYRPTAALRAAATPTSALSRLQRGLVVVQFAACALLLVGAVAVHQQVDYLLSADMGFDAERLVSLPMTGPLRQQQDAFARELRSAPGIAAVSRASGSPLRPKINSYEAGGRTVELHNLLVDPHYVKTTGLSVAAGRDFDPDRPGDVFQTVLVNRRAAALLGWEDPVGKTFRRTGRGWPGDAQFEVIGVVEGVHTQSLRAPIRPVVLQVAPPYFSRFVVRAEAGRLPEALASMRSTWQQFVPDRAFSPTLLGSEVAALYEQERRLARGTMAFGGAALVVACLGLYGVAAIVAHRRRREAGLRKALGASTGQVTGRLTGRLLRLVGFGLVLALPLGWLGVNRWYRQFAYAAEVPVGAMLVVGGGTAAVAALVIAVHTLRAAQADPAAVLREE